MSTPAEYRETILSYLATNNKAYFSQVSHACRHHFKNAYGLAILLSVMSDLMEDGSIVATPIGNAVDLGTFTTCRYSLPSIGEGDK